MSSADEAPRSAILDLAVVVFWTLAAVVIVLGELPWMSVRVAVGLPLVLLFPGYAVISAMFPDARAGSFGADEDRFVIGALDRVVLSVILSAAIVPMLAYGLYLLGVGLTEVPLTVTIAGTTIGFVMLALIRRLLRDPSVRYTVAIPRPLAGLRYVRVAPDSFIRSRPYEPRSAAQLVLNLWVLVAFLVLVSAVGYAVVTPQDTAEYTEFAVLTEDEEGELVAAGYPDSLDEATGTPVHLAVENHERDTIEYTIVVAVETVSGANESTEVTDSTIVDTMTVTVNPGELATLEYQLDSDVPGEGNRVSFFLHVDEPPDAPSEETAYRSVSLDFRAG